MRSTTSAVQSTITEAPSIDSLASDCLFNDSAEVNLEEIDETLSDSQSNVTSPSLAKKSSQSKRSCPTPTRKTRRVSRRCQK